jgi:hypothetical protein
VHHGRIVKRTGDGSIIEFRSVVDAVRCAIEVQTGLVERNAGVPPERRIEFRVGIHVSRASRPFMGPISNGSSGSRNYGDRDKGLAPLSLCESR